MPIALLSLGLIVALTVSLNLTRSWMVSGALQAAINDDSQAERAIELLSKHRRVAPDDTAILLQLAEAYRLAGQPAQALAALQEAYRLQPQSVHLQQQLAEAYERTDDLAAADALWSALGMSAARSLELGRAYAAQGAYSEALAWYARALRAGISADTPAIQVELTRAAVLAQGPAPSQIAPYAESLIKPVGSGLTINGGDLIWMPVHTVGRDLYGKPLNAFPSGDMVQGVFWWDDEAGAFMLVDRAGDYEIVIQARHRAEADGPLAIIVGSTTLQTLLVSPDWREYRLSVTLEPGAHLIRLRYLADIGDIFVRTVTIQPVSQ